MTRRDVYMLGGVAAVALIAVFWFMLLAPKRDELSKINTQVAEAQTSLESAKLEAQQFAQARLDFPSDYTTVARLGKAVPADPDIPSLVVQLDRAAKKAGVDFRKLTSESGTTEAGAAAAPAPAPAAPSTDSGSGSGATGASGADSGTTGAAGATSSGAAGATGASGSTTAPAAADAALTPTMPLGVDVGPAGLALTRFSFVFQGSFYRMSDLLHNIKSLVQRRNRQLVISGRLITVGGIALAEGDGGFPQVKASIAATAYLLPQSQGLFAGATAQGPANATQATPAPPAGSAPPTPPTAVVGTR